MVGNITNTVYFYYNGHYSVAYEGPHTIGTDLTCAVSEYGAVDIHGTSIMSCIPLNIHDSSIVSCIQFNKNYDNSIVSCIQLNNHHSSIVSCS